MDLFLTFSNIAIKSMLEAVRWKISEGERKIEQYPKAAASKN